MWLKYSVWIAVMVLAITTGYFGGRALYVKAQTLKKLQVKPFVMERIDYGIQNGVEVVSARQVLARRSDGALVRISVPEHGPVMRRLDLPNGWVAMISDALHIRSSGQLPGENIARNVVQLESTNCVDPGETSTEETLFGQKALRVVRETPNSLEAFHTWRLPALNCAVIQIAHYTRTSTADSWTLHGGSKLTALALIEPDSKMFDPGTNYKEMRPSEQTKAILDAAGVDPATCPKCFAGSEKQDRNYEAWQAK